MMMRPRDPIGIAASRLAPLPVTAALVACVITAGAASPQQADFSTESQLVVLHVAVRNGDGYVDGLDRDAFHVLENDEPQTVSFFSSQDAPVTVGLLVDGSGSMGPNRTLVVAAARAFGDTSNPEDEMFVLGFNERVNAPLSADDPFTHDPSVLESAVGRAIIGRGQSAVYDAVAAGLAYVERGGYERKVLVLVSDGGDNASSLGRKAILARAQASNVVIYTVGVIDPITTESDPGFLKQLSEATGGQSFEPQSVSQVGRALERVSRDIRNMYTIGYVPRSTLEREGLRRIKVEVRLPNGRKAKVRTRHAYLAGGDAQESGDASR